jgi:choloylglycine hydrolase
MEASIPNPLNIWVVFDGMNEAGLTLGAQTLRESEYEHPSLLLEHNVLAQNFVGTLLQKCKDVDQVLEFLHVHRVVGPSGPIGMHWAIADANGRSIVVEYLRGKRVVWENTPRVMTNDPPLDFHWRNLNNYVNLHPNYPTQNDILQVETDVGTVPRPVGNGWNLAGLPGDGSPPSRFVQLFYLRGYATHTAPPKTTDDAIVLASGLLNKVFIPYGTFAAEKNTFDSFVLSPEYTPVGMIKIPSERRLLIRGYRNLQWQQVDLTKLDFTESLEWPVEDGTLGIKDITSSGASASARLTV